ncbi:MAG: RlmI/RlmK family 23S rRNA methyltransferase, partial [Gammaproteobacteria bacterium]|nr:RlmI/RlmK family 23S rRNA methyltransferase [Gammaproteobacteria bacterium]
MKLNNLYLKKREEKRLLAGHLWIYSNEVDTEKSPLKNFSAGECVNLVSTTGNILGSAYINPHSLIVARKYTEKANQVLDAEFIKARISTALALRESLFSDPCYRLVFSEGDYLPGLIIDRFDSTFVLQINTAGMEAVKDVILAVLEELFSPQTIV